MKQIIEALEFQVNHLNIIADNEGLTNILTLRLEMAEDALIIAKELAEPCVWKYNGDGTYDTRCGFMQPRQDQKFCSHCGRKVKYED